MTRTIAEKKNKMIAYYTSHTHKLNTNSKKYIRARKIQKNNFASTPLYHTENITRISSGNGPKFALAGAGVERDRSGAKTGRSRRRAGDLWKKTGGD